MPSFSSTPALDSGLRSDQFKEIPESEVKIKNKEEFSLATYQYYLQTCMIRMMKRQGSNLAWSKGNSSICIDLWINDNFNQVRNIFYSESYFNYEFNSALILQNIMYGVMPLVGGQGGL